MACHTRKTAFTKTIIVPQLLAHGYQLFLAGNVVGANRYGRFVAAWIASVYSAWIVLGARITGVFPAWIARVRRLGRGRPHQHEQ